MKESFVLLAAIHVGGLALRAAYEYLKKKRRLNPKNPAVFAMIFTVMIALWVCWFGMCPLDPVRFSPPETVHRFGLGMLLVGIALAVGGAIKLKGVENINRLETRGLYSVLRHPMYTGFILWVIGWALYHGAVVSMFIGILTVANVLWWRSLEERELAARYGKTYRRYQKQTWF
jgi:protein-S-isoprenylcysteine O-methyltransferase Ste14